MAPENIHKQQNSVCKHLRYKMYYVPVVTGDSPTDLEKDDSCTQYWCLKTMQPVGPDDGYVHKSKCCNFLRKCYESTEI